MTIYLKHTCGFIRHGDSRTNALCLVREVAVWLIDVPGRYGDNTRLEYVDERGFHAGSGKFCCIIFGPAGPTREAPAQQGSLVRQPCICLKKKANPQARSAGSTRGSTENNSRVMVA